MNFFLALETLRRGSLNVILIFFFLLSSLYFFMYNSFPGDIQLQRQIALRFHFNFLFFDRAK